MPDRWERILRIVTWGLAAVVVAQFLFLIIRRNPLTGVKVPVVPRWPIAEATAASGTNPAALRTGPGSTNASTTNLATATNANVRTNLVVAGLTNVAAAAATNAAGSTNQVVALTNPPAGTNAALGTNRAALAMTNAIATTNAPPVRPPGPGGGPPPFAGAGPPGRRGSRSAAPAKPLSPLAQARIDRITQSEVLAPVFRPPPMALLGIAGRDAFIRTPNGQATLLREGGESDGIKLLRLGTNRVLIEQAGEKKELIIFDGFGSESLLPK